MNKNIKIIVNYILGPILFILLSWSLYRQILQQPDLSIRWHQIILVKNDIRWVWVLLLMILNWTIETKKWKLLIKSLQSMSWFVAIKSVLAGCSVTMLTPNRTGEFGGRLLFLNPENRLKGIAATLYGSMTQLLVTIVAGSLGVLILSHNLTIEAATGLLLGNNLVVTLVIILMLIITTLLLFILLFRSDVLIRWMSQLTWLQKRIDYLRIWESYTKKELLSLLCYSSLRYLVFILQYLILLDMMQVNIEPVTSACLISIFYLFLAIVPTIGFTELPVRGSISAVLLGLFSSNALGIQVAGLSIWLINLVIPAFVGSLFILGVKLMKEKNEWL